MEDKSIEQTIREIKEKFDDDYYPYSLGVKIVSMDAGYSKIKLATTRRMKNLHGMIHGGVIFTLADTAFGLAANTRGKAVGIQVSINYLRPVMPGDVLIAIGEEEELTKSTGIYNVTVETEEGKKVALFRGVVFRIAE